MASRRLMSLIIVLAIAGLVSQAQANPFATDLISFTQGANGNVDYNDGTTALGAPSSTTGSGQWVGDVTVFNPAYNTDQIVSIGAGGELIVKFDHQVLDNPSNVNWGFDLLVFGNAYYIDGDWPNGVAYGVETELGNITVSQDGLDWFDVTGVFADDEFPTQGYTNTSGPYECDGGIESDFTRPVDPGFSVSDGMTYSEILAGYNGSGGGTGVDFSGTGLEWIRYVKVYQDSSDTWSTEVDAFADVVPEPTTIALFGLGGLFLRKRRA